MTGRRLTAALVLAFLGLTGCGVPTNGDPTRITEVEGRPGEDVRVDEALGHQEAGRELLVMPRSSHGHGERLPVHPDLQGLLHRHAIGIAVADHRGVHAGRGVQRFGLARHPG